MVDSDLLLRIPSLKKIHGSLNKGLFEISTDSRYFKQGQIFMALNGSNFQGIQFVEEVLKTGCPIVVIDQMDYHKDLVTRLMKEYSKTAFVEAKDTMAFYQELAQIHAKIWLEKKDSRKLIGITGSNGKTTTKEMLFQFLKVATNERVLSTEKNFNNHIGVPKTLLRLDDSHEVAIIEMGTNHPGEIRTLCEMTSPNCGIITNIGKSHLEFFHNEENIFKEKRFLYDFVKESTQGKGPFVIDGDDVYLQGLEPYPELISVKENNFLRPSNAQEASIRFTDDGVDLKFRDYNFVLSNHNLTGRHNYRNLVTTFLMALMLFPKKERELLEIVPNLLPLENRSGWIEYGGKKFFLDAYNANPSSMKESILGFASFLKKKGVRPNGHFYVLGCMNELGEYSRQCHYDVAKYLEDLGGINVAFIGKFARYYQEGFRGSCIISENAEEFKEKFWPEIQKNYQYYFIKGSRSLKLESLLNITGH